MIQVRIPGKEYYNERTEEFHTTKPCTLLLEHSLLSVSKWESQTHRCFIDPFEEMTYEDTISYIRCMVVSPKEVDPYVFYGLSNSAINSILQYIQDPMTGTTFSSKDEKRHIRPKKMSSEEIYWQMVEYGIPFEAEKWHLNRLMTLIKICGIKNTPPKKHRDNGLGAIERAQKNRMRQGKKR